MIKVVVCRTGREPVVEEIGDGLAALQSVVGGYIESCSLGAGLLIVCNEDGMALELPQNRCGILGDFFFTKFNDEGDFVTLSDTDVSRILASAAVFKDVKHHGSWPEVRSFNSAEEMDAWMENRAFDEEHRN